MSEPPTLAARAVATRNTLDETLKNVMDYSLAGLGLVLWAVTTMGWKRLRIQPVVNRETRLVTTGPYRLARHPMYTATLLASAPLIVQDFTWFRLVVWLLLAICLHEKSRFKETLLCAKFADYSAYRQRVKRLIPWVY